GGDRLAAQEIAADAAHPGNREPRAPRGEHGGREAAAQRRGFPFALNRTAERSLARAASTARSRGSAVVSRVSIRMRATAATCTTARLKGTSFAFEGLL